jgi:hypothetical protein
MFMQKQITVKQAWIEVATTHGTEFLDAVTLGLNIRDSQTETHSLTDKERESVISKLSDYCEGTIQEWKTIRGHGARLSAPGYLDCTEWTVFDTEKEAEEYLDEMYGDDEEEA